MTTSRARVLVVDDEPDFLEVMQLVLESEGYDVAVAESGPRALDRARQAPFDLVITDMRMPGMSGLETLVALREIDPRLRVIVATGFASEETRLRFEEEGACDYLTKPIDLGELLTRVDAALGASRPRAS
jgi:CheY-like chemotaxis protein